MSDPMFACLDCGADTLELDEYYMVQFDLWLEANPDDHGMLCLGCLETRLGRQLTPADFTAAPINHGVFPRSDRFLSRLGEPS